MIRRAFALVILPITLGWAYGLGCGPYFSDLEHRAQDGEVDAKLRLCESEARDAFYVQKKPREDAMASYRECLRREGIE